MLDRPATSSPVTDPAAARASVASSPALDPSIPIVVCIPSFRRPEHLKRTLASLAAQQTSRRFAVVVVENDPIGADAAAAAARFLRTGALPGLCVVEPRQGNCHAINAAFETALAAFPAAQHLLMIDDDEIASPAWLETMVRTAEATAADIVGGPVFPRFEDPGRQGLEGHPAFAPAYRHSGEVPVIYGCGNCLIRRSVFGRLGSPAFDPRFNFLGGGDVDFFDRCRQAGMRFHWAASAFITETVPESRTATRWLALRGLRIGAINYHVQRKRARTPWAQAMLFARLLARLPLSFLRAIAIALSEQKPLQALHPVAVALGGALAAIGVEPQPYKASKIT